MKSVLIIAYYFPPSGGKYENVFDIMQGVSINIFVKGGKK